MHASSTPLTSITTGQPHTAFHNDQSPSRRSRNPSRHLLESAAYMKRKPLFPCSRVLGNTNLSLWPALLPF
ncbi:hypothetical protein DY000_02030812 [Brassica cretica]|uniref:Uncharacterized protein n=1 Tax=Brassica cretica TaxID=69181 RepID=A0ABQ7DVW7_BRACR|nr:hypothetical protein DY000_02030812 [Brassica cretica]